MALSFNYSLAINALLNTATDTGSETLKAVISKIDQFGSGTGSRNANQVWSDTRSLVATSEDLDLTSLPAATGDSRGAGEAFSKIKFLYIFNNDAEGGDILLVGGAAGTQWAGAALYFVDVTDKVNVKPQGFMCVEDNVGMAVAAGTKDLKIDAGAGTISYTIVICGEG